MFGARFPAVSECCFSDCKWTCTAPFQPPDDSKCFFQTTCHSPIDSHSWATIHRDQLRFLTPSHECLRLKDHALFVGQEVPIKSNPLFPHPTVVNISCKPLDRCTSQEARTRIWSDSYHRLFSGWTNCYHMISFCGDWSQISSHGAEVQLIAVVCM